MPRTSRRDIRILPAVVFSFCAGLALAGGEAKRDPTEPVLLDTRRVVDTEKRPNFGWQLPAPKKETAPGRLPRTIGWAFVDIAAEKKARLAQYDEAIAQHEKRLETAKEEEKKQIQALLIRIRTIRAQVAADYGNLRCKVQQIGDPKTVIALHSRPLNKKVRLVDFVKDLREDLGRNFSDLKLTDDGEQDRRFQRSGWEGIRFIGQGKWKRSPDEESAWFCLLHYRKVTKGGEGMHLWVHALTPTWRVDREFLAELNRVLAGLRVGG